MENDAGMFFGRFVRHPWRVGAVLPSSAGLAARVVAPLPDTGEPVVVELGASTHLPSQRIPAWHGRTTSIHPAGRLRAKLLIRPDSLFIGGASDHGLGGTMVPLWSFAVLTSACVVAVLLMWAAGRYGAMNGLLRDTTPATGAYGVLGVAFAVLLAFVLFFAFDGYNRAHAGASQEAVAVGHLVRLTKLFPEPHQDELRGEIVCYGRAVVSDEWPKMAAGADSALVANWLAAIDSTVNAIPVENARTEVALSHWLDSMTERREGRRARLYEATSPIPASVWLMLILGCGTHGAERSSTRRPTRATLGSKHNDRDDHGARGVLTPGNQFPRPSFSQNGAYILPMR
jgi:hypothetical protein